MIPRIVIRRYVWFLKNCKCLVLPKQNFCRKQHQASWHAAGFNGDSWKWNWFHGSEACDFHFSFFPKVLLCCWSRWLQHRWEYMYLLKPLILHSFYFNNMTVSSTPNRISCSTFLGKRNDILHVHVMLVLSGETIAFTLVVYFLFHVKMTSTLFVPKGVNCVCIWLNYGLFAVNYNMVCY